MDSTFRFFVTTTLVCTCLGQHHYATQPKETYQPQNYYQNSVSTPPTQIIHQKQVQNHDGNFKYAFAAENGLQQGEIIAPDGTRNGEYSYVDPTGRKISVKYTAGKDGFKILEGDHIPKDPPHAAHVPHHAYSQPTHYSHASESDYNDDRYSQPAPQYVNQPKHYSSPLQYNGEDDDKKDALYHDEPGKPHSFGSGYAFEIKG
ncbi:hypothetical protein FQR65_LT14862 [Abscondita terminalis]|nr:hypothetical protein FQR65_LT14862 [Abscondita terminalis]